MLQFPDLDPVAMRVGPLAIHGYGLAYLAGLAIGWWLLTRRAARGDCGWTAEQVSDLVFCVALGAVLGGRLGYALFYNFAEYLHSPWAIFKVWRGGMSFHGGTLGFIIGTLWYARSTRRGFWATADFVVPVVPIGLFFGRLANFVNQELWGAPTTVSWAVMFTNPAAGYVGRHPSQLYEALLEGLVLFFIVNWAWQRRSQAGLVSATFLGGYAVFRIAVEFVREPDVQIGYLYGNWLTLGQVLSLPMLFVGLGLVVWRRLSTRACNERNLI